MINLRDIYGNKILDRKKIYRNVRYIPPLSNLFFNMVIAWIIVELFPVTWDYAFIKVYAILLLIGFSNHIFFSLIDFLNYRLTIKQAIASEMRHYLSLFKNNVNWNEVGTYDDFLLEAAFNKSLSADLRVLAAINYGTITEAMFLSPHRSENRFYKIFCELFPDFITKKEQRP